ncbi:MAG: hypothetical protein EX271_12030 [Acidimicrobiales bacterium]|nr:hypothetical protein [Hyphomonadaceae bacterium]RZV36690.1 MAG: hypothetical protein EX271_12030 [Acidimicrobiales bacterium]
MKALLWPAFWLFVGVALFTHWDAQLLQFNTPVGFARVFLIIVWIVFVGYSIVCSRNENIFKTIGVMNKHWWGRQIGIDLYISVFLSIALVYLVTGSIFHTVLWSLAFIPFANMAILLFIILNLDKIVAAFIG